MLVISARQMLHMQHSRNEQVKVLFADDLAERFPSDEISHADLVAQIGSVWDAGHALGIRSGELMFQHVLQSKIIGTDYAEVIPFMKELLATQKIDEPFKVIWLEKWLAALQASAR